MEKTVKYARRCDITGEGMNEGWVWCDGAFYSKYLKDTMTECVNDEEHIIEGLIGANYEPYNAPEGDRDINSFNEICDKVMAKEALTPEQLLNLAFITDYCFFTNWHEDPDAYEDGYYAADGKWVEENNNQSISTT
jgi:hypothetical protein